MLHRIIVFYTHLLLIYFPILLSIQIPLYVTTKILPVPLTSFFVPTPDVYSKACLRWIGYEPLCIPYWRHSLEGSLIQAMPTALMDWMILQYSLHLRRMEKKFKGDSQMPNEPPLSLSELRQETGLAQTAFTQVMSMFLGPWYRFGQSSGRADEQAVEL